MVDKADAILALRPNSNFVLKGEWQEEIEWLDETQTQPTDAEIEAKITELNAEYNSKQWERNRQDAYSRLNQFEMQYDDQVNGTTTWKDAIAKIKTDFPKSGE